MTVTHLIRIATVLAGVFLSAATAAAQSVTTPTVEDRARFQGCLADTINPEVSPGKCRDVVAKPCIDEPGGQSTQGMNACMAREAVLWDELLNQEYRRLKSGLEPEQFEALRDAQRAWIAYKDVKCDILPMVVEGTIASNLAAGCALETLARRAIELQELRTYAGIE